jgi:predicted amidophosphoribosyltransferase
MPVQNELRCPFCTTTNLEDSICDTCRGSGREEAFLCPDCQGTGTTYGFYTCRECGEEFEG